MTEICRKILQEMDTDHMNELTNSTDDDFITILDSYDPENLDSLIALGKFLQSSAHLLRTTENRKMLGLCRRLVLSLTELCEPEDAIINLTEEIEFESETDPKEGLVLIDCMKIAVRRLSLTNFRPIIWCFNSIIRYINGQTELPEEHKLEGQEKLLLDSDPNVVIIESLYTKIVDLVHCVIDEVLPLQNLGPEDKAEMDINLVLFLIKLLGRPMAYMDLEIHGNENAKNTLRSLCEVIITKISRFVRDLFKFLDNFDCRMEYTDSVVDYDFSNLSLGTLYYLIIHEEVMLNDVPQVYSHSYVFRCILNFVLVMLDISSCIVQRKALLLSYTCIQHFEDYGLKRSDLSSSALGKFSQIIPAIMVYSEYKENRILAVKIFRKFIDSLDPLGRYTILLHVNKLSENAGFIGYATTIIKDIINGYLSSDNKRDAEFFRGKRLKDVLKCLAKLPQGVETDLVDKSDTVIATLNLLRYLTLRDKQNETGIWDCQEWILNDYVKPLKKAIDISKAHYELEMKNTDKVPEIPVDVHVKGEVLPDLTTVDRKAIINNAINTLDLIDSLRVRVMECIETSENLN